MKVQVGERIIRDRKIVEPCCKKMKSQLDSYHDDTITCADGKIAFAGWYISYCPYCGKKIEE